MDATYTTGYAKMQKQKENAKHAPSWQKKVQKSMNDFFGKKVSRNCMVGNVHMIQWMSTKANANTYVLCVIRHTRLST